MQWGSLSACLHRNQLRVCLHEPRNVYDQTFDKIQVPADVLKDTSEALLLAAKSRYNEKGLNFESIFADFLCVQSFNLLPRQAFIVTQNNSKEAAGDAIFNAIFEAAPSLQSLLLGWLVH